jgi:ParB family transcriptional regulator, chromosome partitioning protein
MKKKALGKGLEALLPDRLEEVTHAIIEIPIESIIPSKYQPRLEFDLERLESLAESVKKNGVLQPILVRKFNEDYQIIAGERRWKAAKMCGLKVVPVIIRDVVDAQVLELALVENLQREDLNPIEEAMAYKTMLEEFHLTHDELAGRIGKDRTSITNAIRLLKLPEEIRNLLSAGQLSMGHGRALLGIDDAHAQIRLAQRIVKEGLPVRAIEQAIQQKKKPKDKKVDRNVRETEDTLQRALSTKVKIAVRKDKGKIIIYFSSLDEFDRIYKHLLEF